jgi:hypothetical protein
MEFTVNQQTGRLRRDLCGSSTVLASSSRPVIAIPASAPVVSTAALRPTQQFGSLGAYVDGVASWPQETWRQMKRTQSSDVYVADTRVDAGIKHDLFAVHPGPPRLCSTSA